MMPRVNAPGFALRCGLCTLRPGDEAEMGMLAEHFRAEHPEKINEAGDPVLSLHLIVTCLSCVDDAGVAPEMDQGWRDTLWTCPLCGTRRNTPAQR